jgi:uncharacterized membrane protein HdeD (DUF308 family)
MNMDHVWPAFIALPYKHYIVRRGDLRSPAPYGKGVIMDSSATTDRVSIPWWHVLLEGIAAVIIGLFLVTAPGITLLFLVQVTGFFWLIGGVLRIVSIFVNSALWGWKLVGGIIGVLAGIVVLQHPLWSTLLIPAFLVIMLGIQGLLVGGIDLVMAFRGGGWGAGILGALSIVFGIVLLLDPVFIGVAILPFVLGAFALVGGIAAIIGAFRLRKGAPSVEQQAGDVSTA